MRKIPKVINQEEFETIFKVVKESEHQKRQEIMLAMILAFEAGMRISEILGYNNSISRCCNSSIEKKNVERKHKKVKINLCKECGKELSSKDMKLGKEWKIQPLTKEQVNKTSIRVISGKGQKDRIVARPKRVNEKAVSMLPLTIQRRFFQGYITKLGKKVLDKHITAHTYRHGFATHYYNKTKDILGLQQTLGHARTDTTSIYAHTNPEDTVNKIREVFE